MGEHSEETTPIGFPIPTDVHRRLRVQAVVEDTTIRELTARILDEGLPKEPALTQEDG
jgi:hypothetical protein